MRKKINTTQMFTILEETRELEKRAKVNSVLLEQALKERYPSVESIYVTTDTIDVTTEHHSLRRSKYNDESWKQMPKFRCSVDAAQAIETVEEFMAMKEAVRIDYQDCLSAVYYIQFRFDIKY